MLVNKYIVHCTYISKRMGNCYSSNKEEVEEEEKEVKGF